MKWTSHSFLYALLFINYFLDSNVPFHLAVRPVWRMPSPTWEKKYNSISEKHITIVIPSYNNALWYKHNLESVREQLYTNFNVIYIDDCSPDGTGKLVEQYIQKNHLENKIRLIKNPIRRGALANIYSAVDQCADTDIIAQLDGDDWFACNNVLQMINEAYEDIHVWMTYGQYLWFPHNIVGLCKELPSNVVINNSYRTYREWITSQLRTFYAGLFKKIKKEDLLYEGKFYPMAWDVAYMIPMLEMAYGKYQFIPHVTYIYNCATPINDHKVSRELQLKLDLYVRSRTAYQPIFHLTQEEN